MVKYCMWFSKLGDSDYLYGYLIHRCDCGVTANMLAGQEHVTVAFLTSSCFSVLGHLLPTCNQFSGLYIIPVNRVTERKLAILLGQKMVQKGKKVTY